MESIINHDVFHYLCTFLSIEDVINLRRAYLPNHPFTKLLEKTDNSIMPGTYYFRCEVCDQLSECFHDLQGNVAFDECCECGDNLQFHCDFCIHVWCEICGDRLDHLFCSDECAKDEDGDIVCTNCIY